ncbi:MAG: TIM barrel protein [Dysgonamonadaceae bacterium]|jgi:sugar phosphate isomerase/epimerase|nr:TIM barrel protein [Dysgonamonadaceae bacterium]
MKTIKWMGLLLTIALVSCNLGKKPEVAKEGKNIGIQMYSLKDDIGGNAENINSIILKIGELGYKYVEAANYWDGLIYGMSPEDFKAKVEAAGLLPLSCHVNKNMSEDMEEVWAWWDKCIATHKAAGMKFIVVPSMPTPETLEGLQVICDYYNQIGEKCNAAGLKFGYHNHAYEFEKVYDDGTVMYDYMVQHTDPDKVFFQLDVYWCQKGGYEATTLFEKYPGRFTTLHIKDEAELGESGYMDFEKIFNNIDKSGAKYLFVEVERYNFPPIESVKKSLDYLNDAAFVKADYAQ